MEGGGGNSGGGSPGSLSVPAGLTLGAAVRALGVSDFRNLFRREARLVVVYQSVRRSVVVCPYPTPCIEVRARQSEWSFGEGSGRVEGGKSKQWRVSSSP